MLGHVQGQDQPAGGECRRSNRSRPTYGTGAILALGPMVALGHMVALGPIVALGP